MQNYLIIPFCQTIVTNLLKRIESQLCSRRNEDFFKSNYIHCKLFFLLIDIIGKNESLYYKNIGKKSKSLFFYLTKLCGKLKE